MDELYKQSMMSELEEEAGEAEMDMSKLELQVLKDPPRTMMTASSSEPSGASRHSGSEDEGESAFVPLIPIPEASDNQELAEGEELGEYGDEQETNQNDKTPIIEISELFIKTPEEARRIAKIILQILEQDLYELMQEGKFTHFLNRHLSDSNLEKQRRKKCLRNHYPKSSLVSSLSELDFDVQKPSTLILSCDTSDNLDVERRHKLPKSFKADASSQAHFHRETVAQKDELLEMQDGFCQTKEFTLIRHEMAHREFIKLYPKPDYWHEPPPPPSRNQSLQKVLDLAGEYNPKDDILYVGPKPKYRKPLTERMLKPLSCDYKKQEVFWTGSTFQGKFKDNMFDLGRYNYPTLSKYESEFEAGHLHSKKHFGVVTYPRGDTFEGTWRKGRFTDGKITFGDGLKFEPMGWRYCTSPDRRFFIEKICGIQGVGETSFSDRIDPHHIPFGCYDVGVGIYQNGQVINYRGVVLRKPTLYEHNWIALNCRKRKPLIECYEPLFMRERTPDCYAVSYHKITY